MIEITMNIYDEVKQWMRAHAREYPNATALAEAAANHFYHDEWLDDDTHPIWDWAVYYHNYYLGGK